MNTILAVGDMHCKQTYILPFVSQAIKKLKCDTVVFMGDYVDEYLTDDDEMLEQLEYQVKWYKKESKNTSIHNLCGNHDWAYLTNAPLCPSGCRTYLNPDVKEMLESLDVYMAFSSNNTLFTHAGVHKAWAKNNNVNVVDAKQACADLNNMYFENQDQNLNACSSSRGGYDNYPGPLWCDQKDICSLNMQSNVNYNQVVGHTPQASIINDVYSNGTTCTFVDTMSCNRGGKPVGDGSLLMLEPYKNSLQCNVIKRQDVGESSWSTCMQSRMYELLRIDDIRDECESFNL